MLTDSELAWLVQRNPRGNVGAMFFSCHNCDEADKNPRRTKYKTCRYRCKIHKTHKFELLDALEFEGRVAARLAEVAAIQKKHHYCVDIDIPFHCPGWQSCAERIMSKKDLRPCAFEMLRGARIEIEEEMDGQS